MAKNILPTDYKDDLISESMNGKRRYRLINNPDGTISLEDVTEYEQLGSLYGAKQINSTNQAVNESFDKNKIVKDMDTIQAMTQEGYVPDALALKEMNESLENLGTKEFTYIGVGSGTEGTVLDIGEYTEILFYAQSNQDKYCPTFISVNVLKAIGKVCTNVVWSTDFFQIWVSLDSNNVFKAYSYNGNTNMDFQTVVYAR